MRKRIDFWIWLFRCLGDDVADEIFVMTKDGFIMTDDSICLDAPEKEGLGPAKVRIMACSSYSRQKWVYDEKVSTFSSPGSRVVCCFRNLKLLVLPFISTFIFLCILKFFTF